MKSLWRHIMPLLAATFLMSLLPACSDDTPEIEEDDSSRDVWLSLYFNMGTQSTRALDEYGHEEEEGDAAENFIGERDLSIVFLDKDTIPRLEVTKASAEYMLMYPAAVDKSQWCAILKIDGDKMKSIGSDDFFVLIIANTHGTSAGGRGYTVNIGEKYNGYTLATTEERWWFNINSNTWKPLGTDESCIPMCGMIKVTPPPSWDLYISRGEAFHISTIPMMRAMMKVRVVDAIQNDLLPDESFYISDVSIKGVNKQGSYLPTRDKEEDSLKEWFEIVNDGNSRILETATGAWTDGGWKMDENVSIPFLEGESINLDGNRCKSFNVYLPEIKTHLTNVNPIITIVTTHKFYQKNADGSYITDNDGNKIIKSENSTWDFTVRDYIKDNDGNRRPMVRNHIYQFVVTLTEKDKVKVDYTICPWINMNTQIEFN